MIHCRLLFGQSVLSFLKRERKLGARDAGGHARTLGFTHDAKSTVVGTFAHLLQTKTLALSRAADALFLRICHELAPDEQGPTLHEKTSHWPLFTRQQPPFAVQSTRSIADVGDDLRGDEAVERCIPSTTTQHRILPNSPGSNCATKGAEHRPRRAQFLYWLSRPWFADEGPIELDCLTAKKSPVARKESIFRQ